ncbi:SU10 major capsid protein [Listeria monocytogenes]
MKKTTNLLSVENLDLSQAIALASPTDTPFSTMLMQSGLVAPANATTITWRERKLSSTKRGPQVEGFDATDAITTSRTEKKNNQQLFTNTAEVSGTLEAISVPGVPGGEIASEINDRMIELKLELENYLLTGTLADEAGATGRQMNGLINLINSSNKFAPSTAGGLVNKDDLVKAMQLPWANGLGGDKLVMCNSVVKEYLDKLFEMDKGVTLPALQGAGNVIGLSADRIHTNYGDGNILINRWMPAETIVVFDLQNCKLRPLRDMTTKELAKTGDASKVMIVGEYSLEFNNSYGGSVINGVKGFVNGGAS